MTHNNDTHSLVKLNNCWTQRSQSNRQKLGNKDDGRRNRKWLQVSTSLSLFSFVVTQHRVGGVGGASGGHLCDSTEVSELCDGSEQMVDAERENFFLSF